MRGACSCKAGHVTPDQACVFLWTNFHVSQQGKCSSCHNHQDSFDLDGSPAICRTQWLSWTGGRITAGNKLPTHNVSWLTEFAGQRVDLPRTSPPCNDESRRRLSSHVRQKSIAPRPTVYMQCGAVGRVKDKIYTRSTDQGPAHLYSQRGKGRMHVLKVL